MAVFILRTRSSLFAHPLRRARPSSVHLHAGTKYRIGYRVTLPRCNHVLTTERILVPSISVRSFGLASNLSAVDPTTLVAAYGVKKGADYVQETFKSSVGIKILPSKPHHAYQGKELEVRDIETRFDKLKRDYGTNRVVGVYITGGPASGKTQLAREFGEWYYKKLTRDPPESRKIGLTSGGIAVVATIDARTPTSLLLSYLRLAEDFSLPVKNYGVSGNIGNRVAVICVDVQKALAEKAPNWLLIIDGIDPGCLARFHPFLPEPGDDDWGQGQILVTTRYDRITPSNRAERYAMPLMSEANAVSLLHKVSGYEGEGAEAVVNSHGVGRMPLDVVSAGMFINKVREGDSNFTYATYLERIEKIAKHAAQKHDYRYSTTISAIASAATELVQSDEWLKKVFTILAFCANEPLPMSTFKRFLAAELNGDPSRIQAIKDCALLNFLPEQGKPTDRYDAVERVYFNNHIHTAFKCMFTGRDRGPAALIKQHQELVKTFAGCLLEEYENATATHPNDPQWMRQLLLPHLKEFHQTIKAHSFDQNLQVQLCVALSDAYIDVVRDPERACSMLEKLQAELKQEEVHPRHVAKMNLELWKVYRHLGKYEMSTMSLMTALNEKSNLEEKQVASVLKELTSSFSCDEYTQSRKQLEETLQFYEIHVHKPEHGPKSPVVAEALCKLTYLYVKMREQDSEEDYLERSLQELKENFSEGISPDPSILAAIVNLATTYLKIGEHEKIFKLLQCTVQQQHKHTTAVAIPPSKLHQDGIPSLYEEGPLYDNDAHRNKIFQERDPIRPSRTDIDEHQAIKQFAKEVDIVIQSCNPNEYYASLAWMEAPNILKPDGESQLFERAVQFPNKDGMKITLGVFADYKAAIVWTEQGASCEGDIRKVLSWFPNTKALIGIGIAYGMDMNAVNFCDVLVAKQIADLGDRPRVQEGGIYSRGDLVSARTTLKNIFCKDSTGWHFECSKSGREAKVIVGQLASGPFLLDDAAVKQKIWEQFKFAIGGEMEGWVLYTHIMRDYPDLEVMIIKGVADYGDGEKDGRWQLTAAIAAANYTHFQLNRNVAFYDN